RTHGDLRRVLMALVLSYVLLFPYALRQMLRFDARLGVGVYETNYLATILVLVVPLAFVFAAQQRVRARRRLWTAGGLVLVTMLFLTSSRGGFVGLLVAAMVFVYRRRGPTGALAVMAGLVASIFVLPTDLGTRALATLFQDAGEVPPGLEQSNRAHVALFWAALRMIADNPLLGVGPLNFKTLSTLYTGLEQGNIAHNTFLEVAAEFGLPVFAVFALLLLTVFGCLTRAARLRGSAPADEVAGWAEGLRSGLVGYLVAGLFISAQYEKILWLVVFVTIVLDEVARRHAALAETQEAEGLELAPEPTR
ncbi:MAG TPA: O-antigen ligase family protein, partial [Methylomirabilota bacterium]|nr:O-antigen ligase family protein [Methylomirabilota bacterium]